MNEKVSLARMEDEIRSKVEEYEQLTGSARDAIGWRDETKRRIAEMKERLTAKVIAFSAVAAVLLTIICFVVSVRG